MSVLLWILRYIFVCTLLGMLTLINHILHDEGDDFAVILDLVLQKKEASVRW